MPTYTQLNGPLFQDDGLTVTPSSGSDYDLTIPSNFAWRFQADPEGSTPIQFDLGILLGTGVASETAKIVGPTGASGDLLITAGRDLILEASDDVVIGPTDRFEVSLADDAGANSMVVQNASATDVFTVSSVGDVVVGNNLTVVGTTTTTHSEEVNLGDNFLYMNAGYTTAAAMTAGLVMNVLPTATNDTVAAGGFTAGVLVTSNATVATTAASVFSDQDVIQISGATNADNNGLFEVLSHAANLLTIRGFGGTGNTFAFFQNDFTTDTSVAGTITQVGVSVLRANGSDFEIITNENSTSGVTFVALGTSTGSTLQAAYDAGNSITTDATGNIIFGGTQDFVVGDSMDVSFDTTGGISFDADAASNFTTDAAALTLATTTSGTLTVSSAATLDIDGVGVDIDASAGLSLDGVGASNLSATSGNLTVSTITSGTLAVTSVAALDMDGTTVTLDGTNGVSIDGSGAASNFTSTSQALTIATVTSGTLAVTSAGALNLTSGAASTWGFTGGVDVTGTVEFQDSSILAFGADADFTAQHNGTNTILTSATGDLIVDNTLATGSSIMRLGTDTAATDFQVQNNSESALFTVLGSGNASLAGNLDINGTQLDLGGAVILDNGTSALILGNGTDYAPQMASLTTAERDALTATGGMVIYNETSDELQYYDDNGATWVTVGTTVGTTLQAAYVAGNTITTSAGEGDLTIQGTEAFVVDMDSASSMNVTGAGLSLSTTTSGEIDITSAGLIDINGSASGIDIDTASGGAVTIDTIAAGITLTTTTSGAIALASAGALNLTSGAASVWGFTGGVNVNGTIEFQDSQTLAFGNDADFTAAHNGTNTLLTSNTGDLVVDNTNVTGATVVRLGTDTSATAFQVHNNSAATLFEVDGSGAGSFSGTLDVTGDVTVAAAIQGTDDGTGVIFGHAGTGASTGSTIQIANLTTAERGYLVPGNGMIIYNVTDNSFQAYENGGWVDLTSESLSLQDAYNNGDTIDVTSANPVEMIVPNTATGPALRIDNENAAGGVGLVLGDDTSIQYGESSYLTTYDTTGAGILTTAPSTATATGAAGAAISLLTQAGDDDEIGGAFTITTGAGGASTDGTPAGTGGEFNIIGGIGGAGSATPGGSGAGGGAFDFTGGAGGAAGSAIATNGGTGGGFTIAGGLGGAASATANAGKGGAFAFTGGTGGVAGGAASRTGGNGGQFYVTGGLGGAAATGPAGIGGVINLIGGQGGPDSATPTVANSGGSATLEGGPGGASSTAANAGASGGATSVKGGAGGSHPTGTGGDGGAALLTGGAAGTGGTTGNGGNVAINAGSGATDGTIVIGTSNASAITISHAGVVTNIGDALSVTGGITLGGTIQGTNDGTGIVVGHAGTGASTGSAIQISSVTTTERGYLVPANGMMVYDSTLNSFYGYENGSWVDLTPSAATVTLQAAYAGGDTIDLVGSNPIEFNVPNGQTGPALVIENQTTTTGGLGLRLEDDTSLSFGDGDDATIQYDENGNDRLQFKGADVELGSNLVFGVTGTYDIGADTQNAANGYRPQSVYANNIFKAGTTNSITVNGGVGLITGTTQIDITAAAVSDWKFTGTGVLFGDAATPDYFQFLNDNELLFGSTATGDYRMMFLTGGSPALTIDSPAGAPSDAAGPGINITAATGGTYSAIAAGVGGVSRLEGGQGGEGGAAHVGGVGGGSYLIGGTGGSGAVGAGAGGAAYVVGGDAGALGSNADGGHAYIRGGNSAGTGKDGSIILGDSNTADIIAHVEIHGPDDGTGIVIGHAGSGAGTGSALQLTDFNSTSQGYLTADGGMLVYRSDTGVIEYYDQIAASWKTLGTTAGTSLQVAYNAGATITTAGSVDIGFTLTSGDFTVDGGAINFGGTTPQTTFNLDTSGAITLDSSAGGISLGANGASDFTVDSANLTLATTTSGTLAVTSVAALDMDGTTVTLDGTNGVSIDGSGAASNFSSTSQNLTISTITSGVLAITGAALVDLNAGANLDIDVTGTFDMLASSTFSIDGTGPSNVTATSGNLVLSTATSGDVKLVAADNIILDAADHVVSNSSMVANTGGVAAGEALYITALGKLGKADADAAGRQFVVGFADANAALDAEVSLVSVHGTIVTVATDLSGDTNGDVVYLAKTAGAVTTTAPSASGDTVFRVGYIVDKGIGAGSGRIIFMPQYITTIS